MKHVVIMFIVVSLIHSINARWLIYTQMVNIRYLLTITHTRTRTRTRTHTHTHTYTHTQLFYGSLDFVQDNPGEPVPEETFTTIVVIIYLSAPSIYYDPWHPPYSILPSTTSIILSNLHVLQQSLIHFRIPQSTNISMTVTHRH